MNNGWWMAVALAALGAAGCASSSATVTRTPWPSSSHAARADSGRTAPAAASAHPGEASSEPSAAETGAAPGTVDVDMTPPADSGADPYDTTFVSPGRIEEISEKEILEELPARPDTARSEPMTRDTASASPHGPLLAPTHTSHTTSETASPPASPPRPSSSTAPPPRPDARAIWVVQLHASSTLEAAQFAARQIGRELGMKTLVREVEPAAMPFKVIAGHCTDRACADTLRASAVAHGYLDAWVTSVPAAEYDRLAGGR